MMCCEVWSIRCEAAVHMEIWQKRLSYHRRICSFVRLGVETRADHLLSQILVMKSGGESCPDYGTVNSSLEVLRILVVWCVTRCWVSGAF